MKDGIDCLSLDHVLFTNVQVQSMTFPGRSYVRTCVRPKTCAQYGAVIHGDGTYFDLI